MITLRACILPLPRRRSQPVSSSPSPRRRRRPPSPHTASLPSNTARSASLSTLPELAPSPGRVSALWRRARARPLIATNFLSASDVHVSISAKLMPLRRPVRRWCAERGDHAHNGSMNRQGIRAGFGKGLVVAWDKVWCAGISNLSVP